MVSVFSMELERDQRRLMRSLSEFVDALRDIKPTKNVDDIHLDVFKAVRVLCASSEAQTSVAWHEEAWRHGLVPTFQRLCLCMTRLDHLEAQKKE